MSLSLGDPTQIVWSIIGKTATYRPNTASGGGGGGLPTGWTQDADDPANVSTNGSGAGGTGSLIVGASGSENVEIDSSGIGATDEDGNQWLVAGPTLGLLLDPVLTVGGAAITVDGSEGATEALRAGNLPITQVEDPTNLQDAATKNYVDDAVAGVPTPTLTDVLATNNDAGTHAILNMADPTDPQDAATKAYVDSHGGGGALSLIETLVAVSNGIMDISGIDQQYQDLIIVCRLKLNAAPDTDDLKLWLNNDQTDGNYSGNQIWANGPNPSANEFAGTNEIGRGLAGSFTTLEVTIAGYSTAGEWTQQAISQWGLVVGAGRRVGSNFMQWTSTDAVTRIQIDGLNYRPAIGSRIDVYGRGTK